MHDRISSLAHYPPSFPLSVIQPPCITHPRLKGTSHPILHRSVVRKIKPLKTSEITHRFKNSSHPQMRPARVNQMRMEGVRLALARWGGGENIVENVPVP